MKYDLPTFYNGGAIALAALLFTLVFLAILLGRLFVQRRRPPRNFAPCDIACDDCGVLIKKGDPILFNAFYEAVHYRCPQD